MYERACRKFKHNKMIWLEFLQYLVQKRSLQKLNKVLSVALQQSPGELEYWKISVYTDLELKGNMFSSRQLMLQGLRVNDAVPAFHLEYLRFELKYFDKIMARKEILQRQPADKVDFIDHDVGTGEQKLL